MASQKTALIGTILKLFQIIYSTTNHSPNIIPLLTRVLARYVHIQSRPIWIYVRTYVLVGSLVAMGREKTECVDVERRKGTA